MSNLIFEQTIAVPRLYSIPLDLAGAVNEIRNNLYYFIKRDGELVGTAAYCKREDGSDLPLDFYNHKRPHSTFDGQTPHEVYNQRRPLAPQPVDLWITSLRGF